MVLKVIGSSSAGNAYILENNSTALLIECGVRFDLIKKALRFNIRKPIGCLISHEHKDHCKYVNDVMAAGINVYATEKTFKAMAINTNHYRAGIVKDGRKLTLGEFTVLPFNIIHDAAEPVGFMIKHAETGNVLFLTDSIYAPYKFRNLHNVIVEANYCQTIIDNKMAEGANKFVRDRVIQSHLSIQTCKELLQANDLSQVNNIVLIHLSDNNSDAARFKREVQEVTGKTVHIADAGMEIPFNRTPF